MSTHSQTPSHEDYFATLADGAPVMIWIAGLDLGCFYFNRAWLEFRGRTLEQEAGNGWVEGVHPEDLQRCLNHYVNSFERRSAFAMSYRLRDAAGDYVWILDRGVPHYLPDGTFLGFFGGCAEIEVKSAIHRHRELSVSLRTMDPQTALRAARDGREGFSDQTSVELRALAQNSEEFLAERAHRLSHASTEMQQLATDMIAYENLPRGACVPYCGIAPGGRS